MPGYANWKVLYKEEYMQLFEEGYPVGDSPIADITDQYLPFPADIAQNKTESDISEEEWEKAYYNLWKVREKGISKILSLLSQLNIII
jgi:hypothetical protein